MPKIICIYCKKKLKSKIGLQRHLAQSDFCIRTRKGMIATNLEETFTKKVQNHAVEDPKPCPQDVKRRRLNKGCDKQVEMDQVQKEQDNNFVDYDDENAYVFNPIGDSTDDEDSDDAANGEDQDSDDDGNGEDEDSENDENEEDSADGTEDEVLEEEKNEQVDPDIVRRSKVSGKQFKKYIRNAFRNYTLLTSKEKAAIRLMSKLMHKKATLDTYDDVMRWHLEESGKLGRYEALGKSKHYISRDKLMQKLRKRYNMEKKYATPRTIILPHTKSKVTIWKKHARDNVISLLTDPRWQDNDWLYFDDNPFGKPPEYYPFLEDINTGEAYLKTYEKLIVKEKQILVPIPLYIDGAVTGQYDKLQVTALKMTLGILNRRARDKEFSWKTLGYVSNYTKEDSRGKKIFVETGHIASSEHYIHEMSSDDENEGENVGPESEVGKAQDYHAILSVLLESLFELIEEGMVVDIMYKGKLYKDCELVFFVPFVKCDGDEADKLCGSYRSRNANVQQLCRYCQCPTDETDNPNAEYPYKTEPMLRRLFERNNVQKLQELSQSCIKNAFHGLRFGFQNVRGIHGACPWELLHAILLGIFKYVRDCFFEQIGPSSATAEEINALSKVIGSFFARQSDRNKPRTKFSNGILKGKLMAKEYTGVMLVIAAILRCQAGKRILMSARKKSFRHDWLIKDWILLVETLLQWESYLNLFQMKKIDVQRLKRKHKFLMYILVKVGNRTTGMGFKVMKVHAMLHLANDILMFGVPMNVDTGSNESHHKRTKVAAKLTQKDIKTFEEQTSKRMDDFHVLDLAMEEINGRPLWDYFSGHYHEDFVEMEKIKKIGGMICHVFLENPVTDEVGIKIATRMKNPEKLVFDTHFLNFAWKLQKDLAQWLPKMPICAEHWRDGYIFRSHVNYRGKGPWRDWVLINWDEGDYPAQIWGFVDLSSLPEGLQVDLDIGKTVERGFYAIVESCNFVQEEKPESDIFTPVILETTSVTQDGDDVSIRKFYFVDVETFKEPLVVIPDVGTTLQYLMMSPRCKWAEQFTNWIRMPHEQDEEEMGPLTAPEEEEEEEEEE